MANKIDTKQLAMDIVRWCKKNSCWLDVIIYFDGKALSSSAEWGTDKGKPIGKDLYEYENKDPRDYFEYVREPNILSMSFEGDLYYIINGYMGGTLMDDFMSLFEQYDLYFELGNAWNLTAYKLH